MLDCVEFAASLVRPGSATTLAHLWSATSLVHWHPRSAATANLSHPLPIANYARSQSPTSFPRLWPAISLDRPWSVANHLHQGSAASHIRPWIATNLPRTESAASVVRARSMTRIPHSKSAASLARSGQNSSHDTFSQSRPHPVPSQARSPALCSESIHVRNGFSASLARSGSAATVARPESVTTLLPLQSAATYCVRNTRQAKGLAEAGFDVMGCVKRNNEGEETKDGRVEMNEQSDCPMSKRDGNHQLSAQFLFQYFNAGDNSPHPALIRVYRFIAKYSAW